MTFLPQKFWISLLLTKERKESILQVKLYTNLNFIKIFTSCLFICLFKLCAGLSSLTESLCSLSTNRPKFGGDFKKFYYLRQLFVFVCFLTLWTGVSPITDHESLIFSALVVMTLISVCSFMWWAGVSPISVIIILGSVIKTALRRARSERKYFLFIKNF